jgi:hypothetical protein
MIKSNIIDKPRKAGAPDLLGLDDYMHGGHGTKTLRL